MRGRRRSNAARLVRQQTQLTHFGTREVGRLVDLSASALRTLVRQRYVLPQSGPRGAWRFSFQDLIALRAARSLIDGGLSTRQISRAVRELRRHLPAQLPLSGLSIRARGERISVREAGAEWEGHSGQYLLALEVTMSRGELLLHDAAAGAQPATLRRARAKGPREPSPPESAPNGEHLFDAALDSEAEDIATAVLLYRRVLRADPRHLAARINLGRLLHERGEIVAAERLYLHISCRGDAVAQFNLAVLLEDQGRLAEAIERYVSAVSLDPALADAHYNLARLYDLQGNSPHTIRHLRAYQHLERPRTDKPHRRS